MSSTQAKKRHTTRAGVARFAVSRLLQPADIQIDGGRPWDMRVHDERVFTRILSQGSLGLGDAYVEGWWDCRSLDQFFARVLRAGIDHHAPGAAPRLLLHLQARLLNLQRGMRAYRVGREHYDLGNDLYAAMLGPGMVYSCAYWKDARSLEEAQTAKLDLICRKLGLQPGMRLLDIGCGWGSLMRHAADRYGVACVGVTVSDAQAMLGRARCAGLPIEIHLQDYREVEGEFDRIASVGMFEHVGYKNHRTFMELVRRRLRDDGLCLLQTIGANHSHTSTDPWIARHIFPNSLIPSARQITAASEGVLVLEDWHGFGADYDHTLMAWYRNFCAHWKQLRTRYGERFYRMWTYYLLSCAGAFRARRNQLWQIVLSGQGLPGGYDSIR